MPFSHVLGLMHPLLAVVDGFRTLQDQSAAPPGLQQEIFAYTILSLRNYGFHKTVQCKMAQANAFPAKGRATGATSAKRKQCDTPQSCETSSVYLAYV